jgi:tetratricopeptide (TPR) repeat protein
MIISLGFRYGFQTKKLHLQLIDYQPINLTFLTMPILLQRQAQSTGSDNLFQLIKTLTKAEKRNFRLYVTRNQDSEELKFIRLFDVLDKSKDYDETALFKKVPEIKKEQLSNLKAHLYKQLLTSLRLLHKNRNADIDIRENIDYAKILYNKGLYIQSLRILDKAKGLAETNHQDLLRLEVIEFEKLIESRHITRSHEGRADELAEDAQKTMNRLVNTSRLSNLSLQLYGMYLQMGHARNAEDLKRVDNFFKSNTDESSVLFKPTLGFFEKVYLYQCHIWQSYIAQDWKNYYRYSYKWVDLFEQEPIMKINDTSLYLKGVHNLLNALFMTLDHERLSKILNNTELYLQKHADSLDENTRALSFHHIYTAKINKHFLEGSFTEGCRLIPDIENQLKEFSLRLDEHRILVFYYKIACLYFGSSNFDKAIDYLNKIINLKSGTLRTDIQCFARMLHLIAHYEKGHFALLEYLTKSVYRFLLKHGDMSGVMQEIMKFLKKSLYIKQKDLKPEFEDLKIQLETLAENSFERRSFIYLDIIAWLESKVDGKTIEQVSKKKFLERAFRQVKMVGVLKSAGK